MKINKKLALAAFGVVLGATALININNVQSVELTDLQKENLEALAEPEDFRSVGTTYDDGTKESPFPHFDVKKGDCIWDNGDCHFF